MHSIYLAPGHLDLVTVSGPDALRFLQGQLTCNVEALAEHTFTYGAACNNKGRVYATFVILRQNDIFYLVFSKGLGDNFVAALKKFLPFYKCTLQLAPSQCRCIGSTGDAAEQLLASHIVSMPDQGAVTSLPAGWICKLNNQYSQYLLCSTPEQITNIVADMTTTGVPQDDLKQWHLATMLTGHFPLSPEDNEKYTPQELNLEQQGYISFNKGCYTGQEIVARMHYRGKTKKRLYLLFSDTCTPEMLATGFNICDQDGKILGHTVKQLPDEEGTLASLALLPTDIAEQAVPLFDAQGNALEFRPF